MSERCQLGLGIAALCRRAMLDGHWTVAELLLQALEALARDDVALEALLDDTYLDLAQSCRKGQG